MNLENSQNQNREFDLEASSAMLEKEGKMEMSRLQNKFIEADTEKRTKIAQEIVNLEENTKKEIKTWSSDSKKESEVKIDGKEYSFSQKAEAGFLVSPDDIKKEIEKIKKEIDSDYKTFKYNSSSDLEKVMVEKENQIRKLEIIFRDLEDKINNDYSKKGVENISVIVSQEENILRIAQKLNKTDLTLVPKARDLIHSWNIADNQDYFVSEEKIKQALEEISNIETKEDNISVEESKTEVLEEELEIKNEMEPEELKRENFLKESDDLEKFINQERTTKKEKIETESSEGPNIIEMDKEGGKNRGSLFERIRGNKHTKVAMVVLGLLAIGCSNDKKEKDKIDAKNSIEKTIDTNNIISPDTLQMSAADFKKDIAKDSVEAYLEGLNSDVADTLMEEVGTIKKALILKSGAGVGSIDDYKMHNDYKVNFIDGITGAIYKNLPAISKTVFPGDIVLRSENNQVFVICRSGIKENNLNKRVELEKPVAEEVKVIKETKTPEVIKQDTVKNENGTTLNNPDSFDFANMPTISLDSLIKANKNAEIKTEIKDTVKEVKTEVTPVKEKKNFFQRLFGKKEKKSDFSKLIGDPKEDIKNNKDQSNLSFDTTKAVIEENIIDNAVDSVAKSNVAPDGVATAPQYVPRTGGTIETGDNNGRSGLQSMPRPGFNLEKDNSNHVSLQEELNESSTSLYPDKIVSTETPKMSEENKNKSQVSKNSTIFGPEKTSKSKEDFLKEEIKSKLKFKPIKNDSIRVETTVAPVTPEKNNSDIMIINKGEGRSIVKIDASLKEYFPKPDSVATIKKDKDGYIIYSDGSKGSTVKLGPEFAEYFSKPNVTVTIERKDDDYFLYSDGRNGSIVKIDKYFAKYFVNKDFTDKDTAVVASQMIDSLKTTGATEVKSEQNYVIEKTEKPAETVPGQIKTMLTLIKTEKGYLVKNSNGTNAELYLAFDVVAQLPGFTGEDTMTYVKNPDNTWSKVVAVVGK